MDHLSSAILMCAILLLFYASRTVKGVNFGELCDDNCTQDKNVCSSTNICVCSDTSFRNAANSKCVNKVAVNGTCSITETSTDQCSDGNSTCSAGASGHKCFCTSAYYGASTTCTPRKTPGSTCALYQCVANAMCNSTKCACNTGYIATPTGNSPTSCKIVAFGDSCTIDIGCGEDNNVCSNSTCVCSDTSSRNTAGDACVNSSDAATIMLAHMHVFIFGTVASLYFLV